MITLEKGKLIFGAYVITLMTGLQFYAWYAGHNGIVFATTSGISGLVAGAILGFELKSYISKKP